MYTVQLVFDVDHPDSEDQPVKDYLARYDLEPRYQWDADDGGRKCHWLQFGGCYLGKHLQEIGNLQRHSVELEVLTEEIGRCLESCSGDFTLPSAEQRKLMVSTLVTEFHRESVFQVNPEGELIAVLEPAEVLESVRRLLSV